MIATFISQNTKATAVQRNLTTSPCHRGNRALHSSRPAGVARRSGRLPAWRYNNDKSTCSDSTNDVLSLSSLRHGWAGMPPCKFSMQTAIAIQRRVTAFLSRSRSVTREQRALGMSPLPGDYQIASMQAPKGHRKNLTLVSSQLKCS